MSGIRQSINSTETYIIQRCRKLLVPGMIIWTPLASSVASSLRHAIFPNNWIAIGHNSYFQQHQLKIAMTTKPHYTQSHCWCAEPSSEALLSEFEQRGRTSCSTQLAASNPSGHLPSKGSSKKQSFALDLRLGFAFPKPAKHSCKVAAFAIILIVVVVII